MSPHIFSVLTILAFVPTAFSHGHQVPMSDDADWATRHMAGKFLVVNTLDEVY